MDTRGSKTSISTKNSISKFVSLWYFLYYNMWDSEHNFFWRNNGWLLAAVSSAEANSQVDEMRSPRRWFCLPVTVTPFAGPCWSLMSSVFSKLSSDIGHHLVVQLLRSVPSNQWATSGHKQGRASLQSTKISLVFFF